MKLIYVYVYFLLSFLSCYSQVEQNNTIYEYLFVDEIPKFGERGRDFSNYLYNNINLPKNFSGSDKVLVSFVIDEEGNVCNIDILKSNTIICRDAVQVVMSSMPKWKPGKLEGQLVKVRLYIELVFKIE
ncbi:MAG: hypothetical protein GXX85_11295 [Ignavibacteria bacterium]|nr:hypothetical protein [Ignavibacteria bacterium]